MSRTLLSLSITASLFGGAALADAPQVAVDIAPVHSLVARVMDGIGTPELIVQSGASPHEYSLRPSEARALQDADLVFWIGAGLTPWLEKTIEILASDAAVTALIESDGTKELELRENALFEAHEHEEHDDHAQNDDHTDGDHEDHDHAEHDPHAWLSPTNAMTWLNVIAGQLSSVNPENANTYFANAAAGRAEIESLMGEVNAILDPIRDGQFIVFHDAYQYFESDFDFRAAGAVSLSDAADPSPARIAEINERIAEQGIDCVLAEPQFNLGLVETILDNTEAKTGILDPLGSDLELGSELYPQLIRNLSTTLAGCM